MRAVHPLAQCLALDVLGDDVASVSILYRSFADFVDRNDVRMVERRGRARFLLEAPHPPGVGGELGWQQLDRHLAPQSRVEREMDLAHAPASERRQNLVSADLRRELDGK